MTTLSKKLTVWAILVAGILMIPLAAKFPWTAFDYIFAGVVLFGSVTAYEVITRNMKNGMHRMMVAMGAIAVVLAIWAWAVA